MINLEALGNSSASFWSYTFLTLLDEGPKPNMSMISGSGDSWEPVFMHLNIPKLFQRISKQNKEHISKKRIVFSNFGFGS